MEELIAILSIIAFAVGIILVIKDVIRHADKKA